MLSAGTSSTIFDSQLNNTSLFSAEGDTGVVSYKLPGAIVVNDNTSNSMLANGDSLKLSFNEAVQFESIALQITDVTNNENMTFDVTSDNLDAGATKHVRVTTDFKDNHRYKIVVQDANNVRGGALFAK